MTQRLDPAQATWHLTFGTYGTRLHGDGRPTVDRKHNERGQPFVETDLERTAAARDRMRGEPVHLTAPQRAVIESVVPDICERGGWTYRLCATPADEDHVHVLLDARPQIDPNAILKWLKRWLGEELTRRWGKPPSDTWWASGGSTLPVKTNDYLRNVYDYIRSQRTIP